MRKHTNATYLVAEDEEEEEVGGESHAKKTSIPPVAKMAMLIFSSLVCAYVTPSRSPIPLTTLPLLFGLVSNERKHNEKPQYFAALIYGIVLSIYNTAFFWVISLFFRSFFVLPLPYLMLFSYFSLVYVVLRGQLEYHDFLGKAIIITLWDPPLLLTIYFSHLIGQRFLHDGDGNFLSYITPSLLLSSLPLPSDVFLLHQNHVTAVVNMCYEYAGPTAEYKKYSIEQLHLPTFDASAPALEDIERAVAFLKKKIHDEGGKVLVHCKGGRARAACVATCYLISQGMTLDQAISLLVAQRRVVERVITSYAVIQEYAEKHTAKAEGKGEGKKEAEEK